MKSSACAKCTAVMNDVFRRLLLRGSGWLLGGLKSVDMIPFFLCGSVGFFFTCFLVLQVKMVCLIT